MSEKRPQCNPDVINKIEANELIWVRTLVIMDKGHTVNNFTKIGWANEREGERKKEKHMFM